MPQSLTLQEKEDGKVLAGEFKHLYEDKQFDKALELCKIWLNKFPQDRIAYYNAGRCYQNLGANADAVVMFGAAIRCTFEIVSTDSDSLEKLEEFRKKVAVRIEECNPKPPSHVEKVGLFSLTCKNLTRTALNTAALTAVAAIGYYAMS